ncbi:HEAT repeat domain-containing protein [Anaeromyxobacter dehalogenans]|uniref:HEAT repeat domain-containing protein n=1 Tax=Anaeromyxobacter dehalogenans (strain 2CP-C) TaxID=290397 RepID=Q2IH22_ANADE|nr:HEAT repeat domain-containing protein [Anaeromyxobacter dehalogenans]ABC83878.1 hypothetical protein Adeh_4114 [Anaeromyxobacter dehalogenans 2CP-C]
MLAAGLAAALALSALAAAPGAGAPSTADEVRALLGTIDRPIPPEAWRALGPEAGPLLEAAAASGAELPSRRARALEGLAARGGARAEALHRRLAADAAAPRIVRAGAVRGLGALLPPAGLGEALVPLLSDRDPRLRRAAAEALAARAPAQGCAAVRAQAAREPGRALARAVQACERAVPRRR